MHLRVVAGYCDRAWLDIDWNLPGLHRFIAENFNPEETAHWTICAGRPVSSPASGMAASGLTGFDRSRKIAA